MPKRLIRCKCLTNLPGNPSHDSAGVHSLMYQMFFRGACILCLQPNQAYFIDWVFTTLFDILYEPAEMGNFNTTTRAREMYKRFATKAMSTKKALSLTKAPQAAINHCSSFLRAVLSVPLPVLEWFQR